jgi:hypothetical protein
LGDYCLNVCRYATVRFACFHNFECGYRRDRRCVFVQTIFAKMCRSKQPNTATCKLLANASPRHGAESRGSGRGNTIHSRPWFEAPSPTKIPVPVGLPEKCGEKRNLDRFPVSNGIGSRAIGGSCTGNEIVRLDFRKMTEWAS